MRWILVFLFLYLVPLVVLFRNYNNFRRSCIYASTYIVVMTTIVITNIYMSGLNRIKDIIYYQSYSFDQGYNEKYTAYLDNEDNLEKKSVSEANSNIQEEEVYNYEEEKPKEKETEVDVNQDEIKDVEKIKETKDDKEIINNFKKEIYEIETIALIPMRDCLPYTKNIAENIKHLSSIKEDIVYAKDKCDEVIAIYENMEIPNLSNNEYEYVLSSARNDVKKAYELRKKAMESAETLVSTKNPKYIGKITQYLNLSDEQINNFKLRLNELGEKLK